jgi:hypothetical protein
LAENLLLIFKLCRAPQSLHADVPSLPRSPPPSPSSSHRGFEYFILVRPDLADLPAKIEWARVNDGKIFFLSLELCFLIILSSFFPAIYLARAAVDYPRQFGSHTTHTQARRIQESRRLTDAQNNCYWFAVLLEWDAVWGEG